MEAFFTGFIVLLGTPIIVSIPCVILVYILSYCLISMLNLFRNKRKVTLTDIQKAGMFSYKITCEYDTPETKDKKQISYTIRKFFKNGTNEFDGIKKGEMLTLYASKIFKDKLIYSKAIGGNEKRYIYNTCLLTFFLVIASYIFMWVYMFGKPGEDDGVPLYKKWQEHDVSLYETVELIGIITGCHMDTQCNQDEAIRSYGHGLCTAEPTRKGCE